MTAPKGLLVARPKSDCKVCALGQEGRQEVNAAIWDGTRRQPRYRQAGKRAYEAIAKDTIGVKAITAHAFHVEHSWRSATADDPATGREEPVVPTDLESMTEQAAAAGVLAIEKLAHRARVGILGDREMLGLAKLGLGARQRERALEQDRNRPHIQMTAIFGLASGHLAELPDAEVLEDFDEASLKAAVKEQRLLLAERARVVSD